jgi:Tfp pilus assembly protein PilF
MASVLCLVFSLPLAAPAQERALAHVTTQEFTTYPFSDPDPVPDPGSRIYPYFRYDGFTSRPVKRKWKVVELENAYIKLTVMPEIGGKIWRAIDKRTGKPFIYANDVVKFRDIALRGPWTSGGIEANFGIMGHAPSVATPVDYTVLKRPDGSVSCVIGGLDLLTQTQWRVDINLPKDKAYFTTSPFWHNATPLEQPYYMWMNAAAKVAGGLRYQFPGTAFIGHDGDVHPWPVDQRNGKDLSSYAQNDFGGYKSYHVYGRYGDVWGAWWQNENFGMAHYAPRGDVAGKKIWIWGQSPQGMIWERLLTDTNGQYSELQSGRLLNQTSAASARTPFKHKGFAPYATDAWSEYWFPVRGTQGYVAANEVAALNLTASGEAQTIHLYALRDIDDELRVTASGKTVYARTVRLRPGDVFEDRLPFAAGRAQRVTLGGTRLVYDAAPGAQDLHRPTAMPPDFDWHSAYGLYLQGKEFSRDRQYAKAQASIEASLEKDPHFLPALVELASLRYRGLRDADALEAARRALAIDAYDPAANFVYGLTNARLGRRADALDGFEMAALDSGYRSAADTELAMLRLREGDSAKAADFARRALAANQANLDALHVLAASLRRSRHDRDAEKVLTDMLVLDPLNHAAAAERYLRSRSPSARAALQATIVNEFPEQTYVELADWYVRVGLRGDALKLLALAPRHPEVLYREAWLRSVPLDASHIDIERVYPFRAETRAILLDLIAANGDWRLRYHLALIDWFHGDTAAAKRLFDEIGDAPASAAFYASRAKLFPERAQADLEHAHRLDPAQWRYVKGLADLYLEKGDSRRALDLAVPFHQAHPDHVIGKLLAKALVRSERYADADALLATLDVLPNEGATEGLALYRESKLMQAVSALKRRDHAATLRLVDAARAWPDNLGVGKGYPADVDERLEDWLAWLALRGMGREDEATQRLARVLAFTPKVEDTVRNFEPANQLTSAWALKAAGREGDAAATIEQWRVKHPDVALYRWCKTVFDTGRPSTADGSRNDGTARVLNALLE